MPIYSMKITFRISVCKQMAYGETHFVIVADVLDYDSTVREFELELRYYV